MSEAPRFGKYTVLQRIGVGGMAEVFQCRLSGLGGFDKLVVVKRILANHVADSDFVELFLDEARIAANLNHSNIIQIYEVDQLAGSPYISMEYVRGPTLAVLMKKAQREGKLNLGHAAKIISGICAGLHYAHHAADAHGRPLNIIHRDVSPHNILVSAEGVPKLLDFGVAKARVKLVVTDEGKIRGKLRFMAPETLRGEKIDGRVDIFAAAACLYEATTGKPVFSARSEPELVGVVMRGEITPPSHHVPGFPAELERILLWALAADPQKRCPSALELREALEKFVGSGPHQSSTQAVAHWISELFPEMSNGSSGTELYEFAPTPQPVQSPAAPEATMEPEIIESGDPLEVTGERKVAKKKRGVPPPPPADLSDASRPTAPPAEAAALPAEVPLSPVERRRAWIIQAVVIGTAMIAGAVVTRLPWPDPNAAPGEDGLPAVATTGPLSAAGKRATVYLDDAEKLMKDKRFGAARDEVVKARDLKASDPSVGLRLARVADAVERSSALHDAKVAMRGADPSAALDAATRAYLKAPDDPEAQRLLEEAKANLLAKAPSKPAEVAKVEPVKAKVEPVKAKVESAKPEPEAKVEPARAEPAEVKIEPAKAKVEPVKAEPAEAEPEEPSTKAPELDVAQPKIAPGQPPALPVDPRTRLPSAYRVKSEEELRRIFLNVEGEAITVGGISADLVGGITAELRAELAKSFSKYRLVEIYPQGMYLLLVKESTAGAKRDAIAKKLKAAHTKGTFRAWAGR